MCVGYTCATATAIELAEFDELIAIFFLPSNTNRVHFGIGERWENGSSDGCNHLRVLFILLMSSN